MADHREPARSVTVPHASGVVLFVVVLAALVLGFWVMGEGVSRADGLIFSAGLLLSGGSVAIALRGGAD